MKLRPLSAARGCRVRVAMAPLKPSDHGDHSKPALAVRQKQQPASQVFVLIIIMIHHDEASIVKHQLSSILIIIDIIINSAAPASQAPVVWAMRGKNLTHGIGCRRKKALP